MSRLVENCPFTNAKVVFKHCTCCDMTKFAKCCGCDSKPDNKACTAISERSCLFSPFFNHLCQKCTDYEDFGKDEKSENDTIPVTQTTQSKTNDNDDDDSSDTKSVSLLENVSPVHECANRIFGNDQNNEQVIIESSSSSDDDGPFSNNFQQAQPLFDDMMMTESYTTECERYENFVDGLLFASDTTDNSENDT